MPETCSLTFLGTGPGFPVGHAFCTALLLRAGEHRFLLDAGEPCAHTFRARELSFSAIDAVLISHAHADHVGGLPMFLQGCRAEGRRRPLPIYLPAETKPPLAAWLDALSLDEDALGFRCVFQTWEERRKVEVENLRVLPRLTSHVPADPSQRGSPSRSGCYSLAIETEERRLVFSADLAGPSDLDAHLAEPADILICELSHFSPDELFSYLAPRSVRICCLTHLAAAFWPQRTALLREARARLPQVQKLLIPSDGEEVAF